MKHENKQYDNASIRQTLFMALHVEGNSKWADKLNSSLRKCHEK